MPKPFHLAIGVHDLEAATRFYREVLGCTPGRCCADWQDLNLFGHQLVLHRVPAPLERPGHSRLVDGHDVPVPHFGVVLDMAEFQEFAQQLQGRGLKFLIEPCVRFAGQTGEQATMFFCDPSGNALEFKAFADVDAQLFAR